MCDELRYVVEHSPSKDRAEARSIAAARVAARTLLEDNDNEGSCGIWKRGRLLGEMYVDEVGERWWQPVLQ